MGGMDVLKKKSEMRGHESWECGVVKRIVSEVVKIVTAHSAVLYFYFGC